MSINKLNTNIDLVRKTTLFKAVNKDVTVPFPSLQLPRGFYTYAVTKNTSALATLNGTVIGQNMPTQPQGNASNSIFNDGITAHGYTWSGALWSTSTSSPVSTTGAYVAAGNNVFVLAGKLTSGNIPAYSTTGDTWTASTGYSTASGDGPLDVIFANGYFFIPNTTGNGAAVSTNGVSWNYSMASSGSSSVTSIAYGAGKYVRPLANGAIQYSTTVTGTATSIATTALYWSQGNNIAFGNSTFVATGQGMGTSFNELRLSTDGITWSKRGPITWSSRSQFTGIAYSGSRYIAVATSGAATASASVSYSTNGVLWTVGDASPFNATGAINGITYAHSRFISVGAKIGAAGYGTLATSTTGATWSYPTATFSSAFSTTNSNFVPTAVAYGNSQYVITNGFGSTTTSVVTSSDLISYSTRSFANTSNINAIAFGNGVFVAVGSSGLAATNPTPSSGTAWTLRTSNFGTSSIQNVKYLNSNFIAFGNAGKIARSSDTGATWAIVPAQVAGTNIYVDGTYGTAGGAKYVAVNSGGGTTGIVVSTDLVAWVSNYVPTAPTFVAGTGTNLGTGTTGTVTLPTSLQNDVMIVAISSTGSLAAVPSGWTSAGSVGASNSDFVRVIYKVMGATPDTTVAITGISTSSTAVAQAYRNIDTTTPLDVVATSSSNTTAATAMTFAAITPATSQSLILGIGGSKSASTFGSPNLTNLTQQAGTTQAVVMGSTLLQIPAATTPALISSVSATNSTVSLALRPANAVSISSGSSNVLNAVTYGTGSGANGVARYVAGGVAGTNGAAVLRDSTDGLTWTARTSAAWTTGGQVNAIVFGNGTFVAVGQSSATTGLIQYSTDGSTWTTATLAGTPTAGTFTDVSFDGTGFIATYTGSLQTFSNQDIWYSTDGINWYLPNGIGSDAAPTKIAVANNRSFVMAAQGYLSVSTDGNSWRSVTVATKGYTSGTFTDVAYGLVGGSTPTYVLTSSSTANNAAFYSTDTLTWTSTGHTSAANTVAWGTPTGNEAFLVAGANGVIYRSTSGTGSWSSVYTSGVTWRKIVFANGLYVAVGSNGTIVTSPTGLSGSWTVRNSGLTSADGDLVDLLWSGSQFIAVGGSTASGVTGTSTMSTDGITWVPSGINAFTAGEPNRVRFVNNEFWALCAAGTAYRSTDGIYWTTVDLGFGANAAWDITFINNLYVAVGAAGNAAVSQDGTIWTATSSGVATDINGVASIPSIETAVYAAIGGGTGRLFEGYLESSVVTITSNGETITQ